MKRSVFIKSLIALPAVIKAAGELQMTEQVATLGTEYVEFEIPLTTMWWDFKELKG